MQAEDSELLSAAGVARMLKVDGRVPHPSVVYRLWRRGDLRAILIRRKLRFEAAEITAYLDRCGDAAEALRADRTPGPSRSPAAKSRSHALAVRNLTAAGLINREHKE